MRRVYDFFGGKKYFFTQEVFITAIIMRVFDKINADQFVDISIWSLGIYATLNVGQKLKDKFLGKGDSNE